MVANIRKLLPERLSGKGLVISIISFILFVSILVYTVYETTKATVTIVLENENEEVIVRTHAETIADLMLEQEWDVQEHDFIEPALNTEIVNNTTVHWKPAKEVVVTIKNDTNPVFTTKDTVKELLHELNIAYTKHDLIEPALNTAITDDLEIYYEAAFQVELTSDGDQREVWTTSTTVADFLEHEDVSLGELDRVEPELDTKLEKETEIQVVRVEKVTDVVEETVAFGTVTRKDNELEAGKEEVIDAGEEGQIKKYYEVLLEDGEEVSREQIKTETVKESADRVVAVGTKPKPEPVSRSASPSSTAESENTSEEKSSGKTMTVSATAYTASCNGCSGVTATGINLNNNRNMKVIAVDPNVIPLGSRVHVEGYGEAVAGDTGGAIKGNKIDVHVPSKAEARRWGRKQVKITILD